jgi:GNAT superfamily N-acetyltransferase
MAGDDALAVEIRPVAPGSAAARAVLTAYFREVVGRYQRRAATDAEVAAAMYAEPSDDLCPPGGLLLLAWQDGMVLGCAGLRLLPAGAGEVTRMFVLPEARRRGLGQRLLTAVEDAARGCQVTRLRLDTSDFLTEACQLYTRNGYQETAPFSDARLANLWLGKDLG